MAPSHVKASVLHGARDLRLASSPLLPSQPTHLHILTLSQEDRPLDPLGPHDVLVAVKTTGLCGSDLHYYSHFRNGDILVREPLTLGHESAGVVTAVGSEVSTLRVGDRVALEVGQPCEKCSLCAAGRYNICPEMRFRSSAKAVPHAQGTLQEVIVHPEKWCHKYVPTFYRRYLIFPT
jgi:L-iditol 2-dehydrogenase